MKKKFSVAFMVVAITLFNFMPIMSVNAGVTDNTPTNSSTTIVKTETDTEEVSYDTDLNEYIATKKSEVENSMSSDVSYKDEWLSLYIAENGIYKYPEYIGTYFTGVTTSSNCSGYVIVGDPNDLNNIDSGCATYNYEVRYKEITVTKASNPNEIKTVNITLTAPKVGNKVLPQGWTGADTENIVDDGTMEPDNYPSATSSTDHVTVDSAYWINGTYVDRPDDWELLFFGTFKEDTYYYAYINISVGTGYTLNNDLTIKVNGETPAEVFAVYNNENTHFVAKIKAVKEEFDYKILDGANQTYKIDSASDLVIKANGELSKLTGIKVDGDLIDEENYTLENGSTILTLKSSYLNTLSVGEHSLTFVYNDGSVDTTFTISNPTSTTTDTINNTNNPQTGDSIMLYISMLGLSLIGLIGAGLYVRKKNFN